MVNINKIIHDSKNILKSKNEHLIFEVKCIDNKLKGYLLLKEQKEFLFKKIATQLDQYEDCIKVLTDISQKPPLGYGKCKIDVCNIYKEPTHYLEKLSPRGLNRMRATQITIDDVAFRILFELGSWYLIQMIDNTIGWIEKKNIEKSNKPKKIKLKKIDSKNIYRAIEKYLDTPYLLGGRTKKGIDCSGFVQRVFLESINLVLPKNSLDQKKIGVNVDLNKIENYDLIFASSLDKGISHVGIFVNKLVFHACMREKKVIKEYLENFQQYYKINEIRRVIKIRRTEDQEIRMNNRDKLIKRLKISTATLLWRGPAINNIKMKSGKRRKD